MSKILLITGATDGIGLRTTSKLLQLGHRVLLHGRNKKKVVNLVEKLAKFGVLEGYTADLSNMDAVRNLSVQISKRYSEIDILINNAGVLKTNKVLLNNGLDVRFAVNAIAPYLLTKQLLPLLNNNGRVINVASAAQKSVSVNALLGKQTGLSDMEAYSQSKLAMIMWSYSMGKSIDPNQTVFLSVNPGSLLGTKMVKDGFGIEGKDINIGADILVKMALHQKYNAMSGEYFDNDLSKFTAAHPDVRNKKKLSQIIKAINSTLLA